MPKDDEESTVDVRLRVNGVEHALDVPARYALSDVLRDRLRLTGLHTGCEQGVCGACMVLIDGEPTVSCLTLAVEAQGVEIHTVEHLTGRSPNPGRLERSFMECGAFQCGFCTPGFLVIGHHILRQEWRNDRVAVRECLSGNVCRCTGYEPIIDAIVAAATEGDDR
jgi:aerobic-type carbon monoxide dehydrogenase small subunit (CoxS/CutS family)